MSRDDHVGIAQMKVSTDPSTVLTAPHLGSCLGVVIYDPIRKIGGVIHCLLPLSKSDPQKAKDKPCMYVDTGVVKLLEELIKLGASKKDLEICVAGGAQINDPENIFEIGKKNFTVLRKILWKNNLLIKAQDVGECHSRTISLNIGTGEVWLKANGELKLLH
ncbi:MAG: chemotaxis protein CheD [Bdellovibrionales bacterium]|nr:chemotaxis protein CheD [Bdellovibrionales bacterium]